MRGENPDDSKADEVFVESLLRFKIGKDIEL